VVQNAIVSVRNARAKDFAKKEAEFQRVVMENGMDYDAQLKFRKKQLEDEQKSPFYDEEAISELKDSIANITKLNRFQKYRQKYAESFADLNGGRIGADDHLAALKESMANTTDPELVLEIRKNIAEAEAEVTRYKDSILKNQVTLATNDGTVKTIDSAIAKVQERKAVATLAGDEETLSAMDVTLQSLQSQRGKTQIEDALHGVELKSITKGLTATQKIDALNAELGKADGTAPVVINGQRYGSAKEYWQSTRDNYIGGYGSGLFKDFFAELDTQYATKVNTAVARDGYATAYTLNSIKKDFEAVAGRPEIAPYADRVEALKTNALAYAFQSTQKAIVSNAAFTGDWTEAQVQLTNFEKEYGVDTEAAKLSLARELNQRAMAAKTDPTPFLKEAGLEVDSFKTPTTTLPEDQKNAPGSEATAQQLADFALSTKATGLQDQPWWNTQPKEKREAAYALVQQATGQAPTIKPAKTVEPTTTIPTETPSPATPVTTTQQPSTPSAEDRKKTLQTAAQKRAADLKAKGVDLTDDLLKKTGVT